MLLVLVLLIHALLLLPDCRVRMLRHHRLDYVLSHHALCSRRREKIPPVVDNRLSALEPVRLAVRAEELVIGRS